MYSVYDKNGQFVYNHATELAAIIVANQIGGDVVPDDDEYLELSEIVGAYSSSYE